VKGYIARKKKADGKTRWYPVITDRGKKKWLQGFDTKKDAQIHLEAELQRYKTTGIKSIQKITFNKFIPQWENNYAKTYIEKSTLLTYHSHIKILVGHFGEINMDDITTLMLDSFFSLRLQTVKYSTVRSDWAVLNSLFQKAIDWGFCLTNPMPRLKKPKKTLLERENDENEEVQIFTIPELKRFMRFLATQRHQYRIPFLVLLWLGLRCGELYGLRWGCIDFDSSVLTVRQRYYRGDFGSPKSKAGIRTVDIPSEVLHELRVLKIKSGGSPDTLVFPNREGRVISHAAFYQSFKTLLKNLGIRHYNPHVLRHTCCSLRIRQGQSPEYICQQMGWRDVSMIYRVYGHLFPKDITFRKTQMQKMENLDLGEAVG